MLVTASPSPLISNLGKGIDVRISDTDAARRVILDLLINKTYTDKVWAVVREYSTNAMDANIAAGRGEKPITITLPYNDRWNGVNQDWGNPTKKSNLFSIRDYGDGLDKWEMEEIFVALGESTKRFDNAQTGQMGIGAKAGFAYGDFRVISIKDGIKTKYLATKNSDNLPTFIPIGSPEKTKEHSGLLIEVNVKDQDIEAFRKRSFYLAQFSKVRPEIINANGYKVLDLIPVLEGDGWSVIRLQAGSWVERLNVVMGNICYAVRDQTLLTRLANIVNVSYGTILYVKMGEVSFSSSREELEYNDHTVRSLNRYLDSLEKKVSDKVSEQIESSTSLFDAFKKFNEYSGVSNLKYFMWRGKKYDRTHKWEGMKVAMLERSKKRVSYIKNFSHNDLKGKPIDDSNVFAAAIIAGCKIVSNLDDNPRKNRWKLNAMTGQTSGYEKVICINGLPEEYGKVESSLDWATAPEQKPEFSSTRYEYSNFYEWDGEDWIDVEDDEIPDGEKAYLPLKVERGSVFINTRRWADGDKYYLRDVKFPVYGVRRTKISLVDKANGWILFQDKANKEFKYQIQAVPEAPEWFEHFKKIAPLIKDPKIKEIIEAFIVQSGSCPNALKIKVNGRDVDTVDPSPETIPCKHNYKKELAELEARFPFLTMLNYYHGGPEIYEILKKSAALVGEKFE